MIKKRKAQPRIASTTMNTILVAEYVIFYFQSSVDRFINLYLINNKISLRG